MNKMPGDDWQKFANTRLLYAWMYAHPGKKLLFMGGEWGQRDEWSHERSLDWHLLEHAPHRGLRELVRHLNYLYKNEPALFDQDDTWESFDWIELHDADNCVLAFMRRARHGTVIVFVMNATPVARHGYRIGVPAPGWWQEILNTDSEVRRWQHRQFRRRAFRAGAVGRPSAVRHPHAPAARDDRAEDRVARLRLLTARAGFPR